jgi:hypothetical protein
MKAQLGVAAILAAALLVSGKTAQAAGDAKAFGEKHQLILSADRLVPVFSYTHASISRTENNVELTNSQNGSGLSLLFARNVGIDESFMVNVHTLPRVAFDFTIIPRLTLGGAVAFGFGLGGSNKFETLTPGNFKTATSRDAPTATAIGIAPRVGYIIPLGSLVAFWPRAGLGFYSVSRGNVILNNNPNNLITQSTTDTIFSVDLDPQFAFVPTEHFFFHFGPLINIPLTGSRSVENTTQTPTGSITNTSSNDTSLFHIGITAGLGGWFNL